MSKNIQAIMPQDEERESFEEAITEYIIKLQENHSESEEHQKNLLIQFLKQAVFPDNEVNTKGRADLVVLNGVSQDSPVVVLIENKSTTNTYEMPRENNMNTKGFQELVSYYLRERVIHRNIYIKKCIITNGLSWFTIDANEFETHFYKNTELVENYQKFINRQLSGHKTEFLYTEVIAPAIDKAVQNGIKITNFDLQNKLKEGKQIELKKRDLTQLYRFFSPENLLKKEIFVDSNKLNKNFYDELLYIMGLEEVKQDNKKVIRRVEETYRQSGSLIENTINRLSLKSDLLEEEQFDVAMQLIVVWINRILFLKLLESQLITFNHNDESYRFLTIEQLPSFEDFYELFFGVLAKPINQRMTELKKKYEKIPYLNSSLFEEMSLEKQYLGIDSLKEQSLEVFSKSKLKDTNNKRKTGKLDFITYLFEFLNSYDFSTAVRKHKDIKNELINASVLGLIFEKINGYKDGSYFTPGKITMFMARKAVRKTIVEKFNSVYGWEVTKIEDIQFRIQTLDDAKRVNEVINSLKICDPAVGSGHFLVSVLNELLAIKSELGILLDEERRSLNGYRCNVINDELVFQDINGDNFIYRVNNEEKNRFQRAIFHEKRTLIENCLFGVDINPSSVNICQLRLWIELLKHSYYDESEEQRELVTLPNIDINIKVGNSLLHQLSFDLVSQKAKGLNFDQYFGAVKEYKKVNDKSKKIELTKEIENLKSALRTTFLTPEQKDVIKYHNQLNRLNQETFFENKEDKQKRKRKIKNAERNLKKAIKNKEENEKMPMWKLATEWRMEFPEVLDEEGNYIGFDLVIANPPYIYSSDDSFSEEEKRYFAKTYPLSRYQANTFGLFLELGMQLINENGHISFIIPNSFLTIKQYEVLRKYLIENTSDLYILNSKDKIFEDANIDNCIIDYSVSNPSSVKIAEMEHGEINEIATVNPSYFKDSSIINISSIRNTDTSSTDEPWNEVERIVSIINENSKPLHPQFGTVKDGLKAYERGKGTPKQPVDKEEHKAFVKSRIFYSSEKKEDDYRPFLAGDNIDRYSIHWDNTYLKYGKHLAAPRDTKLFEGERLLIRRIPARMPYSLVATYTNENYVHEQSIENITNLTVSPYFLLGVINSKIETFWAINEFDMLQRKTFPQLRLYQIKELPIPSATKEKQEEIESLVKEMLDLTSKDDVNNKLIDSLNNKIDEQVMNLYGLSSQDKKFVNDFLSENRNNNK